MSTTGQVINYVFDAINQYGGKDGAPIHDIVNVVSENLARDNVVPRPKNILIHTRRAIDYGLQNGLISQLRPDKYKLNITPVDEGDDYEEPMDDDYDNNDGSSYASDDESNIRQGNYPTQPYYYRANKDSANYQQETTENPYYKDQVLNTGKKSHQKRNKGSFSPSQIPACPIGPTDPQEPSGPGEPRPPLEPPPYTGGTVKTSRHQKHKDNKNDLFNKIAHNSPDADGDELNDDDHDCDFLGDSDDYDNDICSEEFNDFEDDADENVDEVQAGGNDDDDEDDDDEDQDSDDEENPDNYDGLKDQQLRQAKSKKPDKKPGRQDKHHHKKHHKRSHSSSSSSTGSEGHCKHKQKHHRKRFHDKNKCNTMALALPSHNIVKRPDRGVDFLKKRLQIAASRLSQSTEDCCRGSRV